MSTLRAYYVLTVGTGMGFTQFLPENLPDLHTLAALYHHSQHLTRLHKWAASYHHSHSLIHHEGTVIPLNAALQGYSLHCFISLPTVPVATSQVNSQQFRGSTIDTIAAQVKRNLDPYPTNDFVRRELIRQGSSGMLAGTLSGRINRTKLRKQRLDISTSRSMSPIGGRTISYPTTYTIILLKNVRECKKVKRTSMDFLRYKSRRMVVDVTFTENSPAHHMQKIQESFAHIPYTDTPHSWRLLEPAGDILVTLQASPTGHVLRGLGPTYAGWRTIYISREMTSPDVRNWTWQDVYNFPADPGVFMYPMFLEVGACANLAWWWPLEVEDDGWA